MLQHYHEYNYRGCLTVCTSCAIKVDTSTRCCVKCGASSSKFILAASNSKLIAVYLCTTHYPGAEAFDPLTPVSAIRAEI